MKSSSSSSLNLTEPRIQYLVNCPLSEMILSKVRIEMESNFAASQREISCILQFSIDSVVAVRVSILIERHAGLCRFRKGQSSRCTHKYLYVVGQKNLQGFCCGGRMRKRTFMGIIDSIWEKGSHQSNRKLMSRFGVYIDKFVGRFRIDCYEM